LDSLRCFPWPRPFQSNPQIFLELVRSTKEKTNLG
jgi:hypothetical protein